MHIGLATLLASTARREGPLGKMELSPIAQALREQLRAKEPPVPVGSFNGEQVCLTAISVGGGSNKLLGCFPLVYQPIV